MKGRRRGTNERCMIGWERERKEGTTEMQDWEAVRQGRKVSRRSRGRRRNRKRCE